jgi:hypothetical protein
VDYASTRSITNGILRLGSGSLRHAEWLGSYSADGAVWFDVRKALNEHSPVALRYLILHFRDDSQTSTPDVREVLIQE